MDVSEYPFESRWCELPDGALHYVDEGTGPPVLFVHGTPSWSFLWRSLIRGLSPRFRCIAVDHLGFGLSTRPPAADYRPEAHAGRLAAFVERLGLVRPHLIVHDFGGPIGLSLAIERPGAIASAVVFNSWLWPLADDRAVARAARMLSGGLGRLLYLKLNFSVNVMMRRAGGRSSPLSRSAFNQYRHAQADVVARTAAFTFARSVLESRAWLDALWRRRDHLAGLPAMIVWGMEDRFIRPAFLPRWKTAVFPGAQVLEVPDAGHWVADTRGAELVPSIHAFLEQQGGP